ncbi:MAG: 30S ribosomal protein S27e [Candidatus Aenigmatarchaeota archaeon]
MNGEEPDSKFLKVSCSDCENSQIIFNKPTTQVECSECGSNLCEPRGGMGKVQSKIKEVFR